MKYTESKLEQAFIHLLKTERYTYVSGQNIQRSNNQEVLIKEDLRKFLLNRYPDLEDLELETIINELSFQSASNLYESNKYICKLLADGLIFKRNDPSKKDLHIRYLDLDPETLAKNNSFKIVNQLEIQGKELRIPDLIVYINGIPVVVFEFKTTIEEDISINNAFKQLTKRYRRDIPELMKYNAFCVISDGVNNKAGTIFSSYQFFYGWNKITGDEKKALTGIDTTTSIVHGMMNQERLCDIIHHFILFPDTSKHELKILSRYPQYYAANKLFKNILKHRKPEGDGKGGTYFGATGCGKSYTMLFLARLLMRSTLFSSPTIVIISDRTDLDDQLSKDFTNAKDFIGDENIINITSRADLRSRLRGRESGGVFLTTVQKFEEDLEILSDRTNIICISDEAHRSQVNLDLKVKIDENGVTKSYGFAKYLHDSLPNATYVGFTGTPIDKTLTVFGEVVDAYTMFESVNDEITVRLVYEGRAAKVNLDHSKVVEIEKYYENAVAEGASEYHVEASQQAIARMEVVLGDRDRIKAIAQDFVTHYENRLAENATVAGKVMFVCASREIAYKLFKEVIALRPDWNDVKTPDHLSPKEQKEVVPIERIKMVMTRNKDDDEDLWNLLGNKEGRKDLDFQFKQLHSNFKIAIVVDMWLTGFDVPFLDTIYIDKPLQTHNLIQTISRVNRKYEGKDKGLVVDYIGIKKNLNHALGMFNSSAADDFEDIDKAIILIKDQLDLLRQFFYQFDSSKYFQGNPVEQLQCLNKASELVLQTEKSEQFFVEVTKKLKSAYNLACGANDFTEREIDEIHFYFAIKSIVVKLTKGEAPDTAQMNEKVSKMVEDAIISEGVEEIFKLDDNKANAIDLFNDKFLEKISQLDLPNAKIKILERLLKQTISDFKKVNKMKGIEFSARLQNIINRYNERSERDILDYDGIQTDTSEQILDLILELRKEMASFEDLGIDYEEKAFYDILDAICRQYGFEFDQEKMLDLAREIKHIVDDTAKYPDWSERDDIKAQLKMDIIVKLHQFGYPPITQDDVYKNVLEQAENFKKNR
ncbi:MULTISPECIES: type I restriction endonuclease subunit R [unclassified Kaistella]|uniref:type I restriction endonuclease subunit R n=1 Tax=unclassified Kaistella TaxID=2762626 RepID=UPI002733183E|nr:MULTISPECIES: HsdR family type I site-specific deoxyribonuclease [unclassified Kaistella]MDP2453244.1 HsdR family type I site-specific deoxyribonuclease [Kaistella sp. SH11-4b]MDP2456301.1 HsdR family type I site-specific deoxyribonuclease [Kaistella sp. SH40-3]MDP2459057.1 HsdR family type I site-specific deoxyribonuclease [Kaistella sp. SH19-2b]